MKTVNKLAFWAAVALSFLAPRAHADLGFPEYVKFPPQIQLDPAQSLVKEDVGEAEFAVDKSGATMAAKRGQHFARWLNYKPAAGEPAPGYYNGTEERIHKAMTGVFLKDGWQLVFVSENKANFSMRLAKNGKDIWAAVKMDAPQAQVYLEIVEVGGAANKLVLVPPAAKAEKIGDKDDFPYLPPYPGSTRKDAGRGDGPLDVSLPGKSDNEAMLVGTGVMTRNYQGPSTLSKLQFIADYREALIKAGWKVIYPDEKNAKDYGSLVARYTQNGRDVWAKLFYEYGANLWYSVADVGAEDWAAKFDKDCRLPLYGVFFDFNKSTIKPQSEPVLNKAAALLKAKGGFSVEVQGHTDNVGGDDYNLKLSDARAASVKTWLTQHGIEVARMSSKGYGKTQPVADNNTDEGRAKNRRVELVKMGCKKG